MCIKHGVFQSRRWKRVTRCPAQAFNFNKRDEFSIVARFRVLSGHVCLTPTYDAACSFVSSGALIHIQTTNALGRRPRPYSTYLSTVSARAGNRSVRVSWYARFKRVRSSNSSTQLRRALTSSTVSPPVPTTVADPKQSTYSEQIRVATIALHT